MNKLIATLVVLAVSAGLWFLGGIFFEEPAPLTTRCAVVLDGSDSGAKADRLMKIHLPDFLTEKACGSLTYAPINGRSPSTRCNFPTVDLDPPKPPNGDLERIRKAALLRSLQYASAMLKCARDEWPDLKHNSDVVGGISRAISIQPRGDGPYELLVISDFGQNDAKLDLYRDPALNDQDHRKELVAGLNADARIPNLSGSNVVACGFGAGFVRVELLRAFWTELITGPGKGTPFEERC